MSQFWFPMIYHFLQILLLSFITTISFLKFSKNCQHPCFITTHYIVLRIFKKCLPFVLVITPSLSIRHRRVYNLVEQYISLKFYEKGVVGTEQQWLIKLIDEEKLRVFLIDINNNIRPGKVEVRLGSIKDNNTESVILIPEQNPT